MSQIDPIQTFLDRVKTDPLSALNPEFKAKLTPETLQCMTRCGVTYFISVTATITLTSLFVTMPVVYNGSSEQFLSRTLVAMVIFVGIFVNFWMLFHHSSAYSSSDAGGLIPGPDWKFCTDCSFSVPPRSHHCILCRKCILARDHHCFFTGSCVGLSNQRYFVAYCFYCSVGAAYCTYVTTTFIHLSYFDTTSTRFHHFILPLTVLEWLFGYQTLGFLFFIVLDYASVLAMVGAGGIMVWQLFLIVNGKTTFEYWNQKHRTPWSVLKNIRSVFGPYWLVNFIIPFPIFTQESRIDSLKLV